jgi:hypothetical protein
MRSAVEYLPVSVPQIVNPEGRDKRGSLGIHYLSVSVLGLIPRCFSLDCSVVRFNPSL